MIKKTTTKEFFLRLVIPGILMGLSFGFDYLPISKGIVLFFRWVGVAVLILILVLQGLQWILDFIADNFHKTEVEQNGTNK